MRSTPIVATVVLLVGSGCVEDLSSTALEADPLLNNVQIVHVDDLTTAPDRAAGTVHPEASGSAPANPADWTPITMAVPGLLVTGGLASDPQTRWLLRLPDPEIWNGKLVVAGAGGTMGERSADLIISDYVLQKGYAYVAQNKGMFNFAITTTSDPKACPWSNSLLRTPGTPENPLLYLFLLDADNDIAEWGTRMAQAAAFAQDDIPTLPGYEGREVRRTYAMGVSNGGYQVKVAVERYPELFDGGVDWEGPFWRGNGPNFIDYLPVGLREIGNPTAMRAAGFPPDVAGPNTTLWAVHWAALWELSECAYVREIDPTYSVITPDFTPLYAYDLFDRHAAVAGYLDEIKNNAKPQRPLITVHGTLDALITLEAQARPYRDLVARKGFSSNYRLYEIQNGNHVDALKPHIPSLELIQPHAHAAFDLLVKWVERGHAAPPSQCVPRGGAISTMPAATSCAALHVP